MGGGVTGAMLPGQGAVEERGRDVDFSLKCIKDKRIPITVTVVITALIITVIALAGSLPPAHAAHPTSLLRARTAGWDTKGNATTSRRLKGTGTTARATALPSTPPWLPLIQCRSWISCCAIKGSLTTGLASGGNKARASPGSGPTVPYSTTCFRSEGKGSAPTWMNRGSAAPGAIQRDISSASGWMSAAGGSQAPQEGTQHLRSRKGPI
ncbi:uncharacterized protein ACDP82_015924 isoform 6-T7 [Pangshura tecta]